MSLDVLMLVWRSCSGEEQQHKTKLNFYRFTNAYQKILRPTSYCNDSWSFLSKTETSCTALLINEFILPCEATDANQKEVNLDLRSFCTIA